MVTLAPIRALSTDGSVRRMAESESSMLMAEAGNHGVWREWRECDNASLRECQQGATWRLDSGAELASEWANDSHHDSSHEISSKINWEGRRLEPFEKAIFAVN